MAKYNGKIHFRDSELKISKKESLKTSHIFPFAGYFLENF